MPDRVVRVSAGEYRLPCSICGETAASFCIGRDRILSGEDDVLLYSGVTRRIALGPDEMGILFPLLDTGKIASVHAYLEQRSREGIDAYCPECDRAYCRSHYRLEEVMDEGFYDCTYGTCPAGHRRMIDD